MQLKQCRTALRVHLTYDAQLAARGISVNNCWLGARQQHAPQMFADSSEPDRAPMQLHARATVMLPRSPARLQVLWHAQVCDATVHSQLVPVHPLEILARDARYRI